MKEPTTQYLLSAQHGDTRVTLGVDPPETLRGLSDSRALTCPGCGGIVVLHAGTVRAHHFAHLPGAVCARPQSEPETEEHRAGKLLIARWLRERLPEATVIVEAYLPETGQRADVLVELSDQARARRRIALEFQCAALSAREWRRRHRLYRQAGVRDLWLLGGSRLIRETPPRVTSVGGSEANLPRGVSLRTTELERALLWDGAPLLFLDPSGQHLPAESLARFRPEQETQALRPTGRLSVRPLVSLEFPWSLLDWPEAAHPNAPEPGAISPLPAPPRTPQPSDGWLWQWLAQRHRVTPENLSPFFGLPLFGQEALACEPRVWQAAVYYRFVHQRVGDNWWLAEVETWARAYLPLARPTNVRRLHSALADLQEALAAAGLLSLPMGYGRVHARIQADLTTLSAPPDRAETLRLVRYRRTLGREEQEAYLSETPA